MMLKIFLALGCVLLLLQSSCAQECGDIRAMFYNTENLFDTIDNPKTADDEFTPHGTMKWNSYRYHLKLKHIYKVIAGIGEWRPPEIIGLSEVENREVLHDLITYTPLRLYKYGIVHFESPDPRGIDVALLYRSDKIKLISSRQIPVIFPGKANHHTRDILMATLVAESTDTLIVLVNHWPSRRGGAATSQYLRVTAAKCLRLVTDSILSKNPGAEILLMGDFNDEPHNKSIVSGLKALYPSGIIHNQYLYNLVPAIRNPSPTGSIYYRGQWQLFDQVITSGALLQKINKIYTSPDHVHIYAPPFIMQYDSRYLVFRTFPTYLGPRYLGGYSDHLPVYIDLFIKK